MSENLMNDLKNKVVIVTGSSSGIGEATVTLFSQLGSYVVVTGRNEERVSKVVLKCEAISPHNYKPLKFVGDMLDDKNIERLVKQTIERFSRIDVVVNNLGVTDSDTCGSILDENFIQKFQKSIKTDVNAAIKISRLTLPYLIESRGALINVSSVTTFKQVMGLLPSAMAKAAIDALTKGLALEFGLKGVRVNSVNPGYINTPCISKTGLDPKDYEKIGADNSALNRVAKSEEIANVIVFLASRAASFVTGMHLVADGGLLLK